MDFEHLSREQLIETLRDVLEGADRMRDRGAQDVADREDLLQALRVQQLELEAQNRELREAREALERSRSRYAELYELAPLAYMTFDRSGVVRDANRAALAMIGRAARMVVDKPFVATVRFDRARPFFDHLDRCAARGSVTLDQLSFGTPGGQRYLEVASVPVRDGSDTVVGFRSAFLDISQRRVAEDALVRALSAEQCLRTRFEVLDETNLAVTRVLAGDQRLTMNSLLALIAERACAIAFADTADIQLEGRSGNEGGPRASSPYCISDRRLEIPICLGDQFLGRLCIRRGESAPDLTVDDLRTLELLVERAATAIAIAGARQREAHERARLEMLEAATLTLASARDLDSAWRSVRCVSERAVPELADCAILYLVNGEELCAISCVHREREKHRLLHQIHNELRAGQHGASEVVSRVLRDGKTICVRAPVALWPTAVVSEEHARAVDLSSVMLLPLLARGKVLGLLCLGLSGEERRFGEEHLQWAEELALMCALEINNACLFEELQAAVRARDRLLSLVSHDLRGPLNAISLSADALDLEERDGGDSGAVVHVSIIRRSANWMKSLINDLLVAGQVQEGRFIIAPEPKSPEHLIEEAVAHARPLAEARNIRVEMARLPTLPLVWGDESRLLQVFLNLIGNSLKFTPRGGKVQLTAGLRGEVVEFSVADNGPGIERHQLSQLFEPYWTGAQGGSRRGHGLGLGLFIAKTIVEAHGGRIWAEVNDAGGATLRFTVPTARETSMLEKPGQAGAARDEDVDGAGPRGCERRAPVLAAHEAPSGATA